MTTSIRGEDRRELVNALAQGDHSHAELASKFDRSKQAIHQFSARNAAEIGEVRAKLRGQLEAEVADMWIADKQQRLAWRQKLAEDLDGYLEDEELDHGVRNHYTRSMDHLLKGAAEELGQLPPRTHVEVHTQLHNTPEKRYPGWDLGESFDVNVAPISDFS